MLFRKARDWLFEGRGFTAKSFALLSKNEAWAEARASAGAATRAGFMTSISRYLKDKVLQIYGVGVGGEMHSISRRSDRD